LEEAIFAPLRRESGYEPTLAIRDIQEVVVPIKYSLRRSKDRLEEALSKVAQVQKRLLHPLPEPLLEPPLYHYPPVSAA